MDIWYLPCTRPMLQNAGRSVSVFFPCLQKHTPGISKDMFVPHITLLLLLRRIPVMVFGCGQSPSSRRFCLQYRNAITLSNASLQYCIQRLPPYGPPPAGRKRHWHKSYTNAMLAQTNAYENMPRIASHVVVIPSPPLSAPGTPPVFSMAGGGKRSVFLQSFVVPPLSFIQTSLPIANEYNSTFEYSYNKD